MTLTLSSMYFKLVAVAVATATSLCALGQHEGDLIYAIRNGRCEIVSPTNIATNPPFQWMNFFEVPSQDPGIFATNFGWDFWPVSGNGLTVVSQARITPVGISPQLKVKSGNLTFFGQGATNPTYLLIGNQRHKHFNFETFALTAEDAIYSFTFKFTDVKDENGLPAADSPPYTIYMAPDWSTFPGLSVVKVEQVHEELAWLAD